MPICYTVLANKKLATIFFKLDKACRVWVLDLRRNKRCKRYNFRRPQDGIESNYAFCAVFLFYPHKGKGERMNTS